MNLEILARRWVASGDVEIREQLAAASWPLALRAATVAAGRGPVDAEQAAADALAASLRSYRGYPCRWTGLVVISSRRRVIDGLRRLQGRARPGPRGARARPVVRSLDYLRDVEGFDPADPDYAAEARERRELAAEVVRQVFDLRLSRIQRRTLEALFAAEGDVGLTSRRLGVTRQSVGQTASRIAEAARRAGICWGRSG